MKICMKLIIHHITHSNTRTLYLGKYCVGVIPDSESAYDIEKCSVIKVKSTGPFRNVDTEAVQRHNHNYLIIITGYFFISC